MEKRKKQLHGLLRSPKTDESHAMLKMPKAEEEMPSRVVEQREVIPSNTSVWPLEDNLVIDSVRYKDGFLYVTLTNVQLEPMQVISVGVKYTSNDFESIAFIPTNIALPPGQKTVQIPCSRGNPFKFVIRTSKRTGTGDTRNNRGW